MMKLDKVLVKYPFFLILSGLYNLVLISLGISYLYILLYVLGILLGVVALIKMPGSNKRNIVVLLFILFVLVNVFLSLINNSIINDSFLFQGLGVYFLPIIFWTIYFNSQVSFSFRKTIMSLKYHVLIISILGIVQYYLSPDLYGFLTHYSKGIEWASSSHIDDYKEYFRSTSILTSPQIFGGFMALYIITFFQLNDKETLRKPINIALLAVFVVAGLHSGNKSFVAIIFIYFLNYFFVARNYTVIIIAAIAFWGINMLFSDRFVFYDRIFSSEILLEEQAGRLQIWADFIDNLNFFGDGAGSFMNSEFNSTTVVLESFLLQILAELGVIPFLLILIQFLYSYIRSKNTKFRIIIFEIFFLMAIVHVFNSPVFILFWGIMLYPNYKIHPSYAPKSIANL